MSKEDIIKYIKELLSKDDEFNGSKIKLDFRNKRNGKIETVEIYSKPNIIMNNEKERQNGR